MWDSQKHNRPFLKFLNFLFISFILLNRFRCLSFLERLVTCPVHNKLISMVSPKNLVWFLTTMSGISRICSFLLLKWSWVVLLQFIARSFVTLYLTALSSTRIELVCFVNQTMILCTFSVGNVVWGKEARFLKFQPPRVMYFCSQFLLLTWTFVSSPKV